MSAWLLVFLLAVQAHAYTYNGGESDTSSTLWWTIPAAGCVGTTASSNWDMSGTDVPAPACVTSATSGNINKGVLNFSDGTGAFVKPYAQQTLLLPQAPIPATSAYISASPITLTLMYTSGTGGNVRWCATAVCRGNDEIDDNTISFGTDVCVDDAALATANRLNIATILLTTATTTTCATNKLLHLKLYRDSDAGTDTTSGDASLVSVSVAWQRFQ
jgi:hypothetical protein